MSTPVQDIPVKRIDGSEDSLKNYEGQVLLVVNVASQCGLTPQYEGLQKIHDALNDKGFSVLGFPANNFAGQEPGSNEEIAQFCESKFNVSFPMFEKISVKGEDQHPL
ncbi:MAG: glutathione peroxidase, partial [Alphaproteobacteria bacterium]|nr:glutathione peroxidase [Alphaproteobacteria bacterium]